jgi:nucleoside phosphorylase
LTTLDAPSSATASEPLAPRAPSTPLGVIAASDEELAALERRVHGKVSTTIDGCRFVRGRIGASPVVLARTGEGRASAESGMRKLIEREGVGRVAIVGFSGGVSPGLLPGSLLVATRIVDRGDLAPAPDPDW